MPTNGTEKLLRNINWEIFHEEKKELNLNNERAPCLMDKFIKELTTLKCILV